MLRLKKLDVHDGDDMEEKARKIVETTTAKNAGSLSGYEKAFTTLRDAVYSYCPLQNIDFGRIAKNNKVNHGGSFTGAVNLVLSGRPYNIRRARGDTHSAFDSVTDSELSNFMSFCERVMKAGLHGHIFSRALQFDRSYQHFLTKGVNGDEVDGWIANDVKFESTVAQDSCSVQAILLF